MGLGTSNQSALFHQTYLFSATIFYNISSIEISCILPYLCCKIFHLLHINIVKSELYLSTFLTTCLRAARYLHVTQCLRLNWLDPTYHLTSLTQASKCTIVRNSFSTDCEVTSSNKTFSFQHFTTKINKCTCGDHFSQNELCTSRKYASKCVKASLTYTKGQNKATFNLGIILILSTGKSRKATYFLAWLNSIHLI